MNHKLILVDSQKGRILLNEAAYRLISENAPEELPIYVETRDRYLANPEGFTQQNVDEDEVLGIGEVAAVKTFAKVVFPIIAPMLKYLVEKVTEVFEEEVGEKAVKWVRELFSPKVQPQPIFTQDDLGVIIATLNHIAATESGRLNLESNQVLAVRDAVIAKLVLAKK